MGETGMEREMISARFRMDLPEHVWTQQLSTAFPEARFRQLAGVPVEGGAVSLGEIVGENAVAAGEVMEAHPDITEFDVLYTDSERLVARYEGDERIFFDLLGASSVPPEFPVVAKNGVVEFDITVGREQFERIGSVLDARDIEYDLVSVVGSRESESLVTDRQRECLAVALREGYFNVPRECTLEDVADRIGVDKSTASKTIRRGAARVLEWFLVNGDAKRPPGSTERF